MKSKILSLFLILSANALAQQNFQIITDLTWHDDQHARIGFVGAKPSSSIQGIPLFVKQFKVNAPGLINVEWVNRVEESALIPKGAKTDFYNFPDDYQVNSGVSQERSNYYIWVEVMPLKKHRHGQYRRLTHIHLNIQYAPLGYTPSAPNFARFSVLRQGEFFKVACPARGLYKIDKPLIEKITKRPASSINPKNIRLYGNGGLPLPEKNSDPRIDDLKENAVFVSGEDDGQFNDGDYILFYANGPDPITFNPAKNKFDYRKNPFDTKSYYFLQIADQPGKRIAEVNYQNVPANSYTSGMDIIHHEQELVNLLEANLCNEGSGKIWYGEELSNSRSIEFKNLFHFENIDLNQPAKISLGFAAASIQPSVVRLIVDQTQIFNKSIGSISPNCNNPVAVRAVIEETILPKSALINVQVAFPPTSTDSDGWLDFVNITAWRKWIYHQKPLLLFNPTASSDDFALFEVANATSNLLVWDITDITDVKRMKTALSGNKLSFVSNHVEKKYPSYLIFDPTKSGVAPETFDHSIPNQNLHSLDNVDMVIVFHPEFKEQAERLKAHREKHSDLTIALVNIFEIYNEFSSGSKDPTAIRDFARMLYTRNTRFRYLLLLGDASYDYRFINKKYGDQDFVPTYQTNESLNPILAYPSDDYYGLLDAEEGLDLTGKLDISIGRLLARNKTEAKNLVDKIIRYETDPRLFEDWKLNLLYCADDEDNNIHLRQTDFVANRIAQTKKEFVHTKVYMDAYEQVTTPGGERYPEATKAIFDAIFQGSLVFTYFGHGGHTGLAQERVLQNTDVKNWDNYYKLPLVIVASCTFNGFDDPSKTTAGEEGLHNQQGGFLALFSTVRAVYSDDNFELTNSVFDYLFEFENDKPLPIGEIMRRAKNDNSSRGIVENSRKFQLFGDPAQTLAIPSLANKILTINENEISGAVDTFSAMETVKVQGIVTDRKGNKLENFNGTLFATVYDKEIELRTRANDPHSSVYGFKVQKNIIFKGLAEVKGGEWAFQFVVPKDINYSYGRGKIVLYSTDHTGRDAMGYSEHLIIGGVSDDSLTDDKPPVVEVFLNDGKFAQGGITNENPKIYARISDDFGINVTGNSIGHDLTAVLDNDQQNPIVLNAYFKTKLNDFKSGEVTYPLKGLSPGKHTLTITAWDIANNMGQGTLEFYVVDRDNIRLEKLFNYPNPFSNQTDFQFETNLGEAELEVTIQIQSMSGQIVKTIKKMINATGFRYCDIPWDGRDDVGSSLANGVYLYRLSIKAKAGGETVIKHSDLQKLVILR